MPLIRKRRIRWEPVPEATSYVVYAARDKKAFDHPNFAWETTPDILYKAVSGKTELVLPDEWPEFPKDPGMYFIGITSKDDVGNQSDPFLSSGLFKFSAPLSPSQAEIESL